VKRQMVRRFILIASFVLFQTFLIFHLFFSPVLGLAAASQGVVNGSLVIYILLVLASLFFGRAFCGWVCPGAGLNELCAVFTKKRAVPGRFTGMKYVISGVWLSGIAILTVSAGGFHSIDLLFGTSESTVIQEVIMFFGVILMIVPAAFAVGTRANCQYVCWLAPLMIAGTAFRNKVGWPALHLTVDASLCTQCGSCTEACPMHLDVMSRVLDDAIYHRECILCGSCIDACPNDVIRYAIK
jgi:ferredoxin-type protein NapH